MPFSTEKMSQNLSPDFESVHLCDFPQVDEGLIDADLSAEMDALLRLVSLGSSARNSVRIKVRQPLAELKVQPGDDAERRAVERFAGQICEELNIKKVTLHDAAKGPLLCFEVKPNLKTLGPKFGQRLRDVQTTLAAANPAHVAEKIQAGSSVELSLPDGPATLEPTDIIVQPKAPEGWAGVADRGTQVLIDPSSRMLAREGMARDVVSAYPEPPARMTVWKWTTGLSCITWEPNRNRSAKSDRRIATTSPTKR